MSIIRTNSVYFNVKTICLKKFFINVRAILSYLRTNTCRKELGTIIVSFSKENIIARTTWSLRTVVYFYFVIFGINRFFYIWLVKALSIDNEIVLIFLYSNFFVLIEKFIFLMGLKTEVMLVC